MKTRYIITIAAAALLLCGCQRESLAPESGAQYDGKVNFAPCVAGIGSANDGGVRSGLSDGSASVGSRSLTLRSADGRFTIPMELSVTGAEAGIRTRASLINGDGNISAAEFAAAISDTFMVAAWSGATPHVQIIPDRYARDENEDGEDEDHGFVSGGYVSASKEYQKVMYRNSTVHGQYWMTVQPQTAASFKATIPYADDEYIWKKNETKTFYAYANVPAGFTMALLEEGAGQTMTCPGIPTQDVLMGYYTGPGENTGTASIQFYHPLTAVKFLAGDLADGAEITGISIEKVYGGSTVFKVTQEAGTFTWSKESGNLEPSDATSDVSVSLSTDEADNPVLLIPQKFSAASKSRICVTIAQGGETFNVYYSLDGITWNAGYIYTYTIGYNPPLLPGKFSISPNDYVQFSRGNLQATYHEATSSYSWDFAVKQYDYVGENPGNTRIDSPTDNDVVDLFGWSTAKTYYGISTLTGLTDYTGDFVDWGKALDNSDWCTLSKDEWNYIINVRTVKGATGFGNTCVWATVNGVPGLIIFCDGYTGDTSDLTAIPKDCIFLPASGYRSGTTLMDKDPIGRYWTSNEFNSEDAYDFKFTSSVIADPCVSVNRRFAGMSVRLVQKFKKPVESVKIGNLKWATENLAITEFGEKEWKGVGSGTGHIVGDYFQWAAHTGYCGDASDADKGLLLYTSFTNKMCGDDTDAFTFKDGKGFKKDNAPYYSVSAYTRYIDETHTTLDRTGKYTENNDDVANFILGGGWRMPTFNDFLEMKAATYWVWDATDHGYYVYMPKNENDKGHFDGEKDFTPTGSYSKEESVLFFPAAGFAVDEELKYVSIDFCGAYWSSSLNNSYTGASYLYFENSKDVSLRPGSGRHGGFSVRPVHD